LTTNLILQRPNWDIPFHIYHDAFDKNLGVVLGKKENEAMHEIYNVNKNHTHAKLNNTITKK